MKTFSKWVFVSCASLTFLASASHAASGASKVQPVKVASSRPAAVEPAEDWKGKPDPSDFTVGVLGGIGIIDSSAGFSLLGTVSRKIVEPGFVPEINDSVAIELELGPIFASGGNALFYSAHLRWDFHKNTQWSLYALGGLGGFSASSGLGGHFELFPRLGIGGMYKLDTLSLRAELSHELIGVGVVFPF